MGSFLKKTSSVVSNVRGNNNWGDCREIANKDHNQAEEETRETKEKRQEFIGGRKRGI